jgi:hypothetical protein
VRGDGAPVRPEREVGQRDGEVPPHLLHAPPNGLLERLDGGAQAGARHVPVDIRSNATIWELNEGSMSRSADRLRSSGEGRQRCGQRHEETTMPKYLLHDEYTPQEPAGGRS